LEGIVEHCAEALELYVNARVTAPNIGRQDQRSLAQVRRELDLDGVFGKAQLRAQLVQHHGVGLACLDAHAPGASGLA
jgi:hypothetical protein